MGQTCSSVEQHVANAPSPITYEEWARLGVPALIRAHAWLAQQHRASQGRGESSPVVVDFRAPAADRKSDMPMHEDVASLTDVEKFLRVRMPRDARSQSRVLESSTFTRAAAFCLANAKLLATSPLRYTMPVRLADVHTLLPELPGSRMRGIMSLFRRINISGTGRVSDAELDRWIGLYGQKAALPESVFFQLFFKLLVTSAAGSYTVDEFVTAVDRLCTLTEPQLIRWAFWEMAVVGKGPGQMPYIAVSSLARVFKDFRNAARDRTHVSRKLLEQLHLKAKSAALGQKAVVALKKEEAFLTLASSQSSRGSDNNVGAYCEGADKTDVGRLVVLPGFRRHGHGVHHTHSHKEHAGHAHAHGKKRRGSAGTVAPLTEEYMQDVKDEDEGGVESRGPGFISRATSLANVTLLPPNETIEQSLGQPLATSGQDLVSLEDFVHLCREAPYAVFDLIYTQEHFRKSVFGTRYWKRRVAGIADHFRKHGNFAGSGRPSAYGYDSARFRPLPSPWSVAEIPPVLRVAPLHVPRGLRFAVATGPESHLSPPELMVLPEEAFEPHAVMPGVQYLPGKDGATAPPLSTASEHGAHLGEHGRTSSFQSELSTLASPGAVNMEKAKAKDNKDNKDKDSPRGRAGSKEAEAKAKKSKPDPGDMTTVAVAGGVPASAAVQATAAHDSAVGALHAAGEGGRTGSKEQHGSRAGVELARQPSDRQTARQKERQGKKDEVAAAAADAAWATGNGRQPSSKMVFATSEVSDGLVGKVAVGEDGRERPM